MEVIVEYDYNAEESDELTIKKGNIIKNVTQFEEGWFIGSLDGKIGVFPDNFVKILNDNSHNAKTNFATVETVKAPTRQEANSNAVLDVTENARANPNSKHPRPTGIGLGNIFSGKPIQLKQTSLKEVLKEVEANSEKAMSAAHAAGDLPETSPVSSTDRVRVLYPYEAAQPDELDLCVDDVILVTNRTTREEGWWQGKNLRTKVIGLFPDNFVVPVTETVNQNGDKHLENTNPVVSGSHMVGPITSSSNSTTTTTTPTTIICNSTGVEPPKVAAKPKHLVTQSTLNGTKSLVDGTSLQQDIPTSSALNATGRIGPVADSTIVINGRSTNEPSAGYSRYSQYRLHMGKKDGNESSVSRKDDNAKEIILNRSEISDGGMSRLTADRPKQVGRRLPSKFTGSPQPGFFHSKTQDLNIGKTRDTSASQMSHLPRKTPTPVDDYPSHTDTSEQSRSNALRHSLDSSAKIVRAPNKTALSTNRNDCSTGSVDIVRNSETKETSGIGSSKSQNTCNPSNSVLVELKQQVKVLTSHIEHLKEENTQMKADMLHGQRLLTERMHTLTNELDECRKQRAADAIELSRLRTMLTQLDLNSFTRSGDVKHEAREPFTNGIRFSNSSFDTYANEPPSNDDDEDQPGGSDRMVGDFSGGPPPSRCIEINQNGSRPQLVNKNSYARYSPIQTSNTQKA